MKPIQTLITAERQARAEANALRYAYLSEKNISKATRLLTQRDNQMQKVHRLVANICIAGYGHCPASYRPKKAQTHQQKEVQTHQQKEVQTQSHLFLTTPAYA